MSHSTTEDDPVRYFAVEVMHRMQSGKSKPYVFRCRDGGGGDDVLLIVKPNSSDALTERKCEALGSLFAVATGLSVCVPFQLWIPEPLVPPNDPDVAGSYVAGEAIGYVFKRGVEVLGVPEEIPEELQSDAATLYIVDAVSQNPDRTRSNPNVGIYNGRLFPYDFEYCFQHLYLPLFGVGDPPPPFGMSMATHVFQRLMKRCNKFAASRDAFIGVCGTLHEPAFASAIPQAWRTDLSKVLTYVSTKAADEAAFRDRLKTGIYDV